MSNNIFNTDGFITASEQYFTAACRLLPEGVTEHAQNFVRASHGFTRSAAEVAERMCSAVKTTVEQGMARYR